MQIRTLAIYVTAACLIAGTLTLSACSQAADDQPTEEELAAQAEAERRSQEILEERVAAEEAKKQAEEEAQVKAAEDEALKAREAEEAARKAAEEEAAAAAAQEQAAAAAAQEQAAQAQGSADELRAALNLGEDYRSSFVHGEKPAEYQKYIMLHDTEGSGDPYGVISSWDASGNLVAAHFVVGKDGSIVQCVPLDKIAHHAGFGDAGHNALYGVEDESRDDRAGTTPIGDWAPDYGMNSYSVGIEMVHVGGEGYYPEEQLQAVDRLIAYIDAYFGFQSSIIDHKAWRTGNSDTSPEFAAYLANYQDHRTHN